MSAHLLASSGEISGHAMLIVSQGDTFFPIDYLLQFLPLLSEFSSSQCRTVLRIGNRKAIPGTN
jgi:hypothetical protein